MVKRVKRRELFYVVSKCRSKKRVIRGVEPISKRVFLATITDGSGTVVCSFRLEANERYIFSNMKGEVSTRKLTHDEHHWSRATLVEVIQEMNSKIDS